MVMLVNFSRLERRHFHDAFHGLLRLRDLRFEDIDLERGEFLIEEPLHFILGEGFGSGFGGRCLPKGLGGLGELRRGGNVGLGVLCPVKEPQGSPCVFRGGLLLGGKVLQVFDQGGFGER